MASIGVPLSDTKTTSVERRSTTDNRFPISVSSATIMAGWRVRRNAESDALIGMTDFYATILDLLETPVPAGHAQDSSSFAPTLVDPSVRARSWVYAQIFTPNGPGPHSQNAKAVVTDDYKLWFRDLDGTYISEYYDDKPTLSSVG